MRYKAIPLAARTPRPTPRRKATPTPPSPVATLVATLLIMILPLVLIIPLVITQAATAALTVSPSSTTLGTSVTVAGANFAKQQQGALVVDGVTVLTNFKAGRTGAFSLVVALPSSVSAGAHTLTAVALGKGNGNGNGNAARAALSTVLASTSLEVVEASVATPIPTLTPTPSLTPTPTLSPTPAPTTVATPTPAPTTSATGTPAPTIAPTLAPAPTAPPPPVASVVGFGAATVGGNFVPIENVTTLAGLRTALSSCPCNIQLPASQQVWDLNGQNLTIGQANTTLDGGAVIFKDGGVAIQASQVILRDVRGRSGDAQGNGAELDAVNVNAGDGRLSNIVWDRVEALWGPDVSGVIIGAVSDMTIQHSIIGEGLFRSTHPESGDDDGHSLALNLTQLSGNVDAPARITLWENLITTSQGRNPQFADGGQFDMIDNAVFGFQEGPQGNPHRGLNMVGNVFIKVADRNLSWTNVFRGRVHSGGSGQQTLCAGCVYAHDNQGLGFALSDVTGSMGRNAPAGSLSVQSRGSSTTLARVLAGAGAQAPDATTARLLDNVRNGVAPYMNGSGFSAPTPSWN